MKRLVILLLLFFIAVAFSPFLVDEKGYILIAMGDLTIESTVVTAMIMLTIVFIGLLVTLKVMRGGIRLGAGTWHKLIFANRRRALRDFNQGISAYILEDYAKAELLLAKCAEPSQFEPSAYLLAAAAASKQSLRANTDHYLKSLRDSNANDNKKHISLDVVLVELKLLVAQGSYDEARGLLDDYHKHLGHDSRLLSLEIDLCIIEQRFDTVVEHLKLARKQKNITDNQLEKWEDVAFYGVFNQQMTQADQAAVENTWQALPRKIKQRESVILAYCNVLAEHSIIEPLNDLLLPLLKKDTSENVIRQIRTLSITKPEKLLPLVYKQLHKNEQSGKWLSCLAHLAATSGDLTTSQKAFNGLIALAGRQYDDVDLKRYSQILSLQGEHQKANEVLLKMID
jgi:HemY protein